MATSNKNAIYAVLADSVYWDVRRDNKKDADDGSNSNWTPVPDGWVVLGKYDQSGSGSMRHTNPKLDGFTARAYKKSNFS